MTRRETGCGLALACCLLFSSCANYQLGTGAKLAFSSIYVEPVKVKAGLPQSEETLSAQLRNAFAIDGRLALEDSPGRADAVLEVVVTGFHRDVAAVREADTGLASKFSETLTATCTLRNSRSGRAWFENRAITVQRDVFTDNGQPFSPLTGDQLQSEYNTVPLFAEALADKVSHAVLDVW